MKNSVQLIGRPGSEPEVKTFNNTQKIARFNLAVNETRYNAKHERIDDTQWFTIVAWDKIAERVQQVVRKGKQIAIEGSLKNNTWTDKNGMKHISTEIVANDLFVIDWEDKKEE
jgi:single stranded DNA-binding protein (ssb)